MENINFPPKPIGTPSPSNHRSLRPLLYPSANHLPWPSATINISHRHKSTTAPGLGFILLFRHRYRPSSATLLSTSQHFIRLPIHALSALKYASRDTCPKTVSTHAPILDYKIINAPKFSPIMLPRISQLLEPNLPSIRSSATFPLEKTADEPTRRSCTVRYLQNHDHLLSNHLRNLLIIVRTVTIST